MKKAFIFPALTILCVGLLLFGLTMGLNSVAKANAEAEHLQIMRTLLPGSDSFTAEEYAGEDANIHSIHKSDIGYVIETVTAGYADEIVLLIGVSNEGKVTGLVVRKQHETAGLGGNSLHDHAFLSQFLNTSGEAEIGINVDAITGATVTSKAIARCVNSAVAYVTGADIDSGATSWGG